MRHYAFRLRALLAAALLAGLAAPVVAQDDVMEEVELVGDGSGEGMTASDVIVEASSSLVLPTETADERFRWYGEEFIYNIQILGSDAARAAYQVGYPYEHEEHGWVTPLHAVATSTGFFGTIYPMNDTAETLVSPQTGLPLWTLKELDERGSQRSYEVSYDPDLFRANVIRTRSGREESYYRLGPSDTHDALSWIVDLRSRDMSLGSAYVYHIYDGWKLSRLTVRVVEHEPVYTGLGVLDCARLEFTREVLGSSNPLPFADDIVTLPPVYYVTDGPIDLGVGWFSLDDRRLPVGVQIESPLGHLDMILDEWTPPAP